MQRSHKDTFESWLVGEMLLVALLGSATALFLTNPVLRRTGFVRKSAVAEPSSAMSSISPTSQLSKVSLWLRCTWG